MLSYGDQVGSGACQELRKQVDALGYHIRTPRLRDAAPNRVLRKCFRDHLHRVPRVVTVIRFVFCIGSSAPGALIEATK